jgi:universal stress protein E
MRNFHNILFISRGVGDESEGLKQALSLARNNSAPLKVLVICPEFPESLAQYQEKYEESLIEHVNTSVQATRSLLKLGEQEVSVDIEVKSGSTPTLSIIRHVLRNSHDLVIKEPESRESGKGFMAVDMELLRKCPCPVWLCRPIKQARGDIHVVVAIDPESQEPAAHDLALRLLELSRSLADSCSGDLSIISCWEFDFEEYLRHNAWIKMSPEELQKTVMESQTHHRAALESMIRKSKISGRNQVYHLRGHPEEVIPGFIEDKKLDILVRGTVARTGIPGFLIGNTAENILQKIGCSLLALKPNGFVSPVKAY